MAQTEESEPYPTIKPGRFEAVKPYTDRLDRRYPHTLNPLVLLQAVVGPHNIPVDTVPPEFWAQGTDDDGNLVATVACPCGESPVIDALGLGICSCERAFFFSGQDVIVINSQKARPPDPPEDLPPIAAA